MIYTFHPKIATVAKSSTRFGTDTIRAEPMIFGGDLEFVRNNGGPITQHFMEMLMRTDEFQAWAGKYEESPTDVYLVIDSRVNMLMPGMYQSIPGWHGDDVPRGIKYTQPDLERIDVNKYIHFMALYSDQKNPISATEFVTEPVEIDVDLEAVWKSVNNSILSKKPKTGHLEEGTIIAFSQEALHRASACTQAGWRFFIRASFTYRKPVNEIRNQVQVYIPLENTGW